MFSHFHTVCVTLQQMHKIGKYSANPYDPNDNGTSAIEAIIIFDIEDEPSIIADFTAGKRYRIRRRPCYVLA